MTYYSVSYTLERISRKHRGRTVDCEDLSANSRISTALNRWSRSFQLAWLSCSRYKCRETTIKTGTED